MTFAVHIWEYPAPRDSAEAELIRDAHAGMRVPQNPRFIDLAKRLAAEYPCITTLADDEIEERGVWSDGPLDGITGSPEYGLGILSQHIDRVFPFVCDKANELGLNVYEMASGSIHRADGRVLQHDLDAGGPRLAANGLDLGKLAGLMAAQFAPLAAGPGFRKVGYDLVRGIEGGWQSLAAEVAEVEGQVVASAALRTYRYDVMRLVHTIDPVRRGGDAAGVAFALSSHEFHKPPLVLQGPDDFLPAVRTLAGVVTRNLLPAADQCATLAGLDAVMNGAATRLRPFPLNHLVVARLVDQEDFDAVYRRMREQGHIDDTFDAWFSSARPILEAVIPSRHERGVIRSSVGPGGARSGISTRGK
jgi:hypothetical protein